MRALTPNLELIGKTELLKMFHELRGERGFNSALKRGLTEAAIPIQDAASRNSPVRLGALSMSYANKYKRGKGRDGKWSPYIVIGVDTKFSMGKARPVWYLHLQEKGVAAHPIGKGQHPGHAGHHMLERAMEANKGESAKIIEFHMKNFIESIMKRRARKAARMRKKIDKVAKRFTKPAKRIAKTVRKSSKRITKTAKKIAKKF